MLVICIRTVIIFLFLLAMLRLMGKRQIGELQPFEFVITLAVADLACTPMQDISIPILYGIIPVTVVFIVHFFLTLISSHSLRFRKLLNGKPVIVITDEGIDYQAMKKLNMNVNDLLESIRAQEYFSLEQVSFGIIETNGKLSILPNDAAEAPKSIPMTLLVEGKFLDCNVQISNTSRQEIIRFLKEKQLKPADVALLTTESDKIFVQPKKGKYFTETLGGEQ